MFRTRIGFTTSFRFVVVLAAGLACAAPTAAQTTRERATLQKAIEKGHQLIFEVDAPGDSVVGLVRVVDQDAVEVALGSGVRRLRFADINRIRRDGDTNWNGAAIGADIVGGWCALICGQAALSGGQYARVVLQTAITGAGVGFLIDSASKGTTTIYRRRTNVRISGAASPRIMGISATVTWK